jgi:SMI1 / KNR4 family (SUKH-1)
MNRGARGEAAAALERKVALLAEQVLACLTKYRSFGEGSRAEGVLHPAPGDPAVTSFLRNRGKELPPSYKAFLRMHNGWEGYIAAFTLIGINGKHTVEAHRDIEETLDIFLDGWKAQYGEPTAEKIAEVEGWSRDEAAYIVAMIPFGTDFNGALLLFDPKTRRSDGEMEVLLYDTSGPSKRYKDFVSMLKSDRLEMLARMKVLRGRRIEREAS